MKLFKNFNFYKSNYLFIALEIPKMIWDIFFKSIYFRKGFFFGEFQLTSI